MPQGLGISRIRGGALPKTYVKDGLKLFMPYKTNDEVQFVGTGSTSFDGDNDYISIANDSSLDVDSDITLSAWCKADTLIDYAGIMSRTGYYLRREDTGKFRCYFYGVASQINSTTSLVAGVWYHVAVTYDGASAKMYVNGALESTVSMTGDITDGGDLYIGKYSTHEWDGNIKNVAIWNRAITSTEIQNVMYKSHAEVSGRLASGLVSWWSLESTGTPVSFADSHGSNTGASYGLPTANNDLYGGDTPVIPRAIDNAPTVQADEIGSGSASFNGGGDYINLGTVPALGNSFTVMAWAKWDAGTTGIGDYDYIIEFGGIGEREYFSLARWSTADGDDNKFYYYNNFGAYHSTNVLPIGEWVHIAVACKPTTDRVTLYFNGVEEAVAQPDDDFNITASTYSSIGSYQNGNANWMDGNIAQVGIWTGALSQEKIQSVLEKTYEELTATEKSSLGSELVASNVSSEWTPNSDGSTITNITGGVAIADDSGMSDIGHLRDGTSTTGLLSTDFTLTKLYKVSFNAYHNGTGTPNVRLNNGASTGGTEVITISDTDTQYTRYIVATGTAINAHIRTNNNSSGSVVYITNLSVKEVTHDLVSYWALDVDGADSHGDNDGTLE